METLIEIIDSFSHGDAVEALSETGRFLYVYNSTTLIASVGSIVGLILLGSLLWIAISSAAKSDKGYHYGGGSYRRRRFIDGDEKEHSFLELLVMLDETFRKLEINNFDCQKRAVCEAHLPHAEGTVGPVASSIVRIFSELDDKPLSALEPESALFLAKYLEAADRGERNENCTKIYSACSYSLHDFVAKSAENHVNREK